MKAKGGKTTKRTVDIVIRATPEEKEILEALAIKEGLSLSSWVRRFAYVENSVLEKKSVEIKEFEKWFKPDLQLLANILPRAKKQTVRKTTKKRGQDK